MSVWDLCLRGEKSSEKGIEMRLEKRCLFGFYA